MKAQLLKEVHEQDLDKLLDSDDYAISQKLDGVRLIVSRVGLSVHGIGRSGNGIVIPCNIKSDFMKVRSDWTFDGELIGNTYHVFDVIEFPSGSLALQPWQTRHNLCKEVLRDFSDHVKIVPQHFGNDKRPFFERCKEERTEGVVFANINDRYRFGMRSPNTLKYKFVKTIDCVVTDKNINGKDNLVLSVYDNGELVDVGKCSAITGHGKHYDFKIGDVVTVTYLYGTKSRRLYQPVSPILRTDKDANECLMSQMILKTNTVL